MLRRPNPKAQIQATRRRPLLTKGLPKMLLKIDRKSFQKRFLRASWRVLGPSWGLPRPGREPALRKVRKRFEKRHEKRRPGSSPGLILGPLEDQKIDPGGSWKRKWGASLQRRRVLWLAASSRSTFKRFWRRNSTFFSSLFSIVFHSLFF